MKERHPCLEIRWMCDHLNVSHSGYYSYLKATKRPTNRQELDDMDLIRWAYDFKGKAKGARQIKMTLRHEKGITQSMSRKGNYWDNAPMESFFGHMKNELHLENCLTFEQLEKEINDYMDYYNHSRC